MKQLIFISLSLIFILFAGCDTVGSDDDPDAVFLRVMNKSNVDFTSVTVGFPNSESSYSTIPAGQASEYHQIEAVYNYGTVEVKAEENKYRGQPYDFVGEEPLGNGHYTYKLNIVDGNLKGVIVQK